MKHIQSFLFFAFIAFLTTSCALNANRKPPGPESSPPEMAETGEYPADEPERFGVEFGSGGENSAATSAKTGHVPTFGGVKPAKENPGSRNVGPKNQNPLDDALELCELSQEFWQKGELENALEALDQAYDLILKVDVYDKPVLMQQKDDLRFMISKRILEIYASRNIVVSGNFNEIPLTLNQHVQHEIDLFTKGREKNFFLESYKRSGKYRPMIVEALKSAGLPEELSWLPLIESGYKVNALSSARALGLWQFIPSTGYKFGLKRDRYIDERLDFEKSTHAAIAYMKELHQIFGEWSTVLAAYNCGEGRVLRVIRSQNVNYLDNFWDLYNRLPRETARYVPRFLATLHIINNLDKYGLDKLEVDPPLEWDTVELAKKAHIKDIAKTLGISKQDVKALNPELRLDILPSEEYPLRIPVEKKEILIASLDEIPDYTPPPAPRKNYRYHRVRRGETLSTIARRYGVGMKSIARANRLNRKYTIVAGQTLKIPSKYYPVESRGNRTHVSAASGKSIEHVVKAGDSLWVIARKYGTTTKKIQTINGLSNSNLYIGQRLKITSDAAGASGRDQYRVRSGDSPFSIAKRHNMSLKRFLEINRLNSRSKIYPGQVYYVE